MLGGLFGWQGDGPPAFAGETGGRAREMDSASGFGRNDGGGGEVGFRVPALAAAVRFWILRCAQNDMGEGDDEWGCRGHQLKPPQLLRFSRVFAQGIRVRIVFDLLRTPSFRVLQLGVLGTLQLLPDPDLAGRVYTNEVPVE